MSPIEQLIYFVTRLTASYTFWLIVILQVTRGDFYRFNNSISQLPTVS